MYIFFLLFLFFILFYTVADEKGTKLIGKRILRRYPWNTLYSIKNIKQKHCETYSIHHMEIILSVKPKSI